MKTFSVTHSLKQVENIIQNEPKQKEIIEVFTTSLKLVDVTK